MVIVIDNITLLRLENGGLDDVKNILKNFIEQVTKLQICPLRYDKIL